MGEYGMSRFEARRVPPDQLIALWKARERRMARAELRLLDDLYAVAGLQSEIKVEGEKPSKGKKVTPVALNRRRQQLVDLGFPTERPPWTPEREAQKLDAFWKSGGADDALAVVDLAPDGSAPPE